MINFYNIDNIEFMKNKPDNYYDLAIVDPPYGISEDIHSSGKSTNRLGECGNGKMNKWDIKPNKEYFKELFRVSKNQIIWGGNYFIDNLYPTKCFIIWDKVQPLNFTMAMSELAWTSFNKPMKIFKKRVVGASKGGKIHPTQKPIELYRFCLDRYANKNDKILDTHGGSFTNAIACDMENYDLDICEIDKTYFDNGVKAFNEYKKQTTLF
tara:strand:- start:12 stop:641 length:630 start_codon:yes stop_codon:yes gene_type:complete